MVYGKPAHNRSVSDLPLAQQFYEPSAARLRKTTVGRAIYGERPLCDGLFGLKSAPAFSATFGAGVNAP
jgi:hypothetical protein